MATHWPEVPSQLSAESSQSTGIEVQAVTSTWAIQ
eukprot:CAMPEP_0204068956 /NCGR_PEP_ID=MMETSP0360-20130528/156145_1 /ASSEMBLY_ACC=CAM_ASM_000342 /TAXON_ID=268821 /ORGANISM="Scrippsiella Hangoei, Strain SHTV-5" /LENGTH=34 /DNA_ID= /DNA_START= /DNA_END= /DNA_ORIENTATION=